MAYDELDRQTSSTQIPPYCNTPDPEEPSIIQNEIKWNAWMNVLARCPICEEQGVLDEIARINREFTKIVEESGEYRDD